MDWQVRALHVELIRELEAQRHELRDIISGELREAADLRAENQRLRRENEQLRAPLPGLTSHLT